MGREVGSTELNTGAWILLRLRSTGLLKANYDCGFMMNIGYNVFSKIKL